MSRCRFALSPCCHQMWMCPCRSARCWRRCTRVRRTPGGLTTRCQCHRRLCVRRCSAGSPPISYLYDQNNEGVSELLMCMSDGHPKLIPVDKEPNHQVMHAFHLMHLGECRGLF